MKNPLNPNVIIQTGDEQKNKPDEMGAETHILQMLPLRWQHFAGMTW